MGTLTANSVFVRVSTSKYKVANQIAVFEIVFEHVTWWYISSMFYEPTVMSWWWSEAHHI